MSALPLTIVIAADPDAIVEWSESRKTLMHDLTLEGANALMVNTEKEEQILINFYESFGDSLPYADVSIHRDEILDSLEIALEYYVNEELFEKAVIARDLIKTFLQQENIN